MSEHGTSQRYRRGCRCDDCRPAPPPAPSVAQLLAGLSETGRRCEIKQASNGVVLVGTVYRFDVKRLMVTIDYEVQGRIERRTLRIEDVASVSVEAVKG